MVGSQNGNWLVVEPTPLKNMSSSVGMIIPNIWKNKKWIKMFQTTNQANIFLYQCYPSN
jgi:hypothetical protein